MRTKWLMLTTMFLAGCGLLEKGKEATDKAPSPKEVEEAVVDKLHCSGILKEETRELVAHAVEERDLGELATEPVDLARMVVGVTATTNSTALLAGNVEETARRGHFKEALGEGWEGLECGQSRSQPCEDALSGEQQGKLATSVSCESSEPRSVRAEYRDQCRLFGTDNTGAMTLERDGSLGFDQFTFGSAQRVDGALSIETESGEVRRMSVETGQKLTVTSNVGKSCEQDLILRELETTETDERATLAVDAARSSTDSTVRVETLETPVTWQKPVRCSCPTDGAVEIHHSDPVGLGEPGTLRVDFGAGEETCSRASAEIVDWPTDCPMRKDCGGAVVEDLIGALVTASCAELS